MKQQSDLPDPVPHPDFEATVRGKRRRWFRYQRDLFAHFVDGFSKAEFRVPVGT